MAKKITKKTFLWFLILSLLVAIVIGLKSFQVKADEATTAVYVGNVAPELGVPFEDPASWGGADPPVPPAGPTNVGDNVTFKATATDANNDQYYLAICKTNAIAPNNDAPPTCPGGSWCISSATNSDVQASCQYQVTAADAQSQVWWAFACDKTTTNPACSASQQGTGNSGSPFKVNRRPDFTAISNDGPKNPGQSITWTATASDPDDDTYQDKVRLIVCKTTGLEGDDCDGGAADRWCRSDYGVSNPSCSYGIPIPTPDTTYNAFVYIVDWHHFGATGANQGANSSYNVNNIAPVVSSVVLLDTDESGDLTLTVEEEETPGFKVTGTVSDDNSCQDIATVVTSVYRSGVGWPGCDTEGEGNRNHCYPLMTCTVVSGTCTGSNDPSADYTCTFSLWYHADPTDNPPPGGTPWTAEIWKATMRASDEALSDTGETSGGSDKEMLSFQALGLVSDSINYGTVAPGGDSTEQTSTAKATGNISLDIEYSGTNMISGGNSIGVQQQKYDYVSGKTWPAMDWELTTSPVEREANVPKTTVSVTPQTKNTYLRLRIPTGQAVGNYTGTDTFSAVVNEMPW